MAKLSITLVRITPGAPDDRIETSHDVPDSGMSVSAALQHIARTTNSGLGYYLSCRRGVCACCAVRIDGATAMACMVEVADGMTIEPVRAELVLKDTAVDLSMAKAHQYRFPGEAG